MTTLLDGLWSRFTVHGLRITARVTAQVGLLDLGEDDA